MFFLLLSLLPSIIRSDWPRIDDGTDFESETRQRLEQTLLNGYERTRIPTRNSSHPVNVSVTMWPYDILYVNEARSSVKISGWFDIRWFDYFLTWKPEEYANITHTFLPVTKVWLPAVDIYYSKEDAPQMKLCRDCYVKIDHTGEILYGQYFAYAFPCAINVKYFPFDEQLCEMQLANWHLDDTMMELYPGVSSTSNPGSKDTAVDLSVFLPNEEWELVNITVARRREFFNYGFFPTLAFRILIRRKPFFYVCNLVIPCFIITVTALIGYHMPSTGAGIHHEKVKMGLTTLLSIFILQLGVSDKMPRTTDVVPLIGIYYSSMVMILSLAIISTGLIILVEKQGVHGKPVPALLQRWVLRRRHCKYTPQVYCNGSCGEYQKYVNGYQVLTTPLCPVTNANNRITNNTNSRKRNANPRSHHRSNKQRQGSCPCPVYDSLCNHPDHVHLQSTNSAPLANGYVQHGAGHSSSDEAYSQRDFNSISGRQRDWKSVPNNYPGKQPGFVSCTNASCEQCIVNANLVGDSLRTIQQSLAMLTANIAENKQKQQIRRDWSALADAVERVSLFTFVSAAFTILAMFFYHDWY